MPEPPRPSEFEMAILRVLWRRDSATVRQVFEDLREERQLGYTTVLKTLLILLDKGLVARDESARSHVYRALLKEDEAQASLVRDLMQKAFGGSAHKLVLAAIKEGPRAPEGDAATQEFQQWRSKMSSVQDMRSSKRIPIENQVRVRTGKGKMAAYVMAINISMGGVLLTAAPSLPVGSSCDVAISLSQGLGGDRVMATGTVIRNDAHGTAIRFAHDLDQTLYQKFASHESLRAGNPLLNSYLNYFKVSQSADNDGSEALLGVSRQTFRKVFLTTFCTSIPLAVLPVWMFQASIPPVPNWLKVVLSFVYGLVWLAIIQPVTDILVFRYLRRRKAAAAPRS